MLRIADNTAVPLKMSSSGSIFVGGTRVTLDTVLHAYHNGDSAEEIVHQFDALKLGDVHATLAYYLRHQLEIDEYLAERDLQRDEIKSQYHNPAWQTTFRERLLARQRSQDGAK